MIYNDLINLALDMKDFEWAKRLVELNDNPNSDKINDKKSISPLTPKKYTEDKDDTIYTITDIKVNTWARMILDGMVGYHQIPDESNFKECVLAALDKYHKC